jgi:hypothetical protein
VHVAALLMKCLGAAVKKVPLLDGVRHDLMVHGSILPIAMVLQLFLSHAGIHAMVKAATMPCCVTHELYCNAGLLWLWAVVFLFGKV